MRIAAASFYDQPTAGIAARHKGLLYVLAPRRRRSSAALLDSGELARSHSDGTVELTEIAALGVAATMRPGAKPESKDTGGDAG